MLSLFLIISSLIVCLSLYTYIQGQRLYNVERALALLIKGCLEGDAIVPLHKTQALDWIDDIVKTCQERKLSHNSTDISA